MRKPEFPTIKDITLYPVKAARIYGHASSHIVVRLEATDGTVGWGEMSDLSHLPAIMPDVGDLECCLRAVLVGQNTEDTNAIERMMLTNFPGNRFYGKACLVRAGVSIATYDLKSRILKASVSSLLGGRMRERIQVCYPIFRMSKREDVAERIQLVDRQVDLGFDAFRFYFSKDSDLDRSFLEEILGKYGNRIRLVSMDGSGLFNFGTFMRLYGKLVQFPFEMVESPVFRDDVESIAEARRAMDHPVSEHVNSPEYALRLIRERAVDIFNISITVAGGVGGMMRLFALAESAGLACLLGTTQELSVATAAQAQVGSAVSQLDYASDPVGPSLYKHDVVRTPVQYEGGCLLVPKGPGLGIEVDFSKVKAISMPLSSKDDVQVGFSRG